LEPVETQSDQTLFMDLLKKASGNLSLPKQVEFKLQIPAAQEKRTVVRQEKTVGQEKIGRQETEGDNSRLAAELHLLKNRHVLDPKRHYRKNNSLFQQAQIGTIINGPTHGRVSKKTLVQETLEQDYVSNKFKEIVQSKTKTRRKKK
jgi:hypothetical protein